SVRGHTTLFVDARVTESYQVHFFEIQIISEEPSADSKRDGTGEARTQVLYATLAAILDGPKGKELAPADLLHDLTPLPEGATVHEGVEIQAPDPQAIVILEQWVRIKVQFPLKQQQAKERQ